MTSNNANDVNLHPSLQQRRQVPNIKHGSNSMTPMSQHHQAQQRNSHNGPTMNPNPTNTNAAAATPMTNSTPNNTHAALSAHLIKKQDEMESKIRNKAADFRHKVDQARRSYQLATERLSLAKEEMGVMSTTVAGVTKNLNKFKADAGGSAEVQQGQDKLHDEVQHLSKEVR